MVKIDKLNEMIGYNVKFFLKGDINSELIQHFQIPGWC